MNGLNITISILFLIFVLLDPSAFVQEQSAYAEANCDLNQPPEGFVALFNGKDQAGWKGLVSDPPARSNMSPQQLAQAQIASDKFTLPHWKVVDGILEYDDTGYGGFFCLLKTFTTLNYLSTKKRIKKTNNCPDCRTFK